VDELTRQAQCRLIDPAHGELSISRQCQLLGLPRSGLYYRSQACDALNEQLMRLIDRQYTATPFFGVRQMTHWLRRQGHGVNVKRVRRLMRLMGLEAVYPKPRLSLPNKAHSVYPYLLKGLTIDRPDQVWCADITYIPMHRGWLYLVAVMDWYSRCVLAWELSSTLDASFCVSALERALSLGTPGIFNTDQGSQFTSEAFTGVLKACGIGISMDGVGRVYDNIFVERLWRSVKYEEVYLKDYQTPAEANAGLSWYLGFYNRDRPHGSHDGRTPAEVYGIRPGEPDQAAALAATPVALRAPCVAASKDSPR
jgi:putative transposase